MNEIRPWEHLENLIDADAAEEIKIHLDSLQSEDIASAVSHIGKEARFKLLTLLNPEDAAEVVEDIPWVQAVKMLENLTAKDAAAIINEMRSDDQVDFLTDMSAEGAEAIMVELEDEQVENIRKLIKFAPNSAGGLMITDFWLLMSPKP